jgi:hypothetical protein
MAPFRCASWAANLYDVWAAICYSNHQGHRFLASSACTLKYFCSALIYVCLAGQPHALVASVQVGRALRMNHSGPIALCRNPLALAYHGYSPSTISPDLLPNVTSFLSDISGKSAPLFRSSSGLPSLATNQPEPKGQAQTFPSSKA